MTPIDPRPLYPSPTHQHLAHIGAVLSSTAKLNSSAMSRGS
jgi:hypothetical protein